MKKTLCSLAVLGALMVGCNDSGLTDEMVKNYEANLNKDLDEARKTLKDEIDGVNVKLPDFKCKKESLNIVCQTSDIVVSMQEQEILSIKDITLKTSQVYTGDKKGEISISEAYANIAKKSISDELVINGFKLSDASKGLIALAAMQSKELAFLPALADGEYNISLVDKYSPKNELLSGEIIFSIDNITKGIKLSTSLKHDVDYKLLTDIVDRYKLATFDVKSQSVKQSDKKDSLGYEEAEKVKDAILKSIIVEKLNINASLKDIQAFSSSLDYVKSEIKDDIRRGEDAEPSRKLLEVIDKFEKSNPHSLSFELARKVGVSLFDFNELSSTSEETDKKLREGVTLKINDIDFTEFLIK